MAHTRFGMDWKWDGQECVIMSRCIDDLGQVQPTQAELAKFFNVAPDYYKTHGTQGADNRIQPWRVASDGTVHNALA
jgi:sulfane dehydrogenase subunit SoxC